MIVAAVTGSTSLGCRRTVQVREQCLARCNAPDRVLGLGIDPVLASGGNFRLANYGCNDYGGDGTGLREVVRSEIVDRS